MKGREQNNNLPGGELWLGGGRTSLLHEEPGRGAPEVPGERPAGVGPLVGGVPVPDDDGGPALIVQLAALPDYTDAPPGGVVADHLDRSYSPAPASPLTWPL